MASKHRIMSLIALTIVMSVAVQIVDTGAAAETGSPDETRETLNASIVGTVTGDHGGAIAGVWVYAHHETEPWVATSTTDEFGEYVLAGLVGGAYRLWFWDPSGEYGAEWHTDIETGAGVQISDRVEPRPIVVAAGVVPIVDAVLDRNASISGTVNDASGAPLTDVWVTLETADGLLLHITRVNATGSWTINGIRAGAYNVRAVDASGSHTPQWFGDSNVAGATSSIEIADGEQLGGLHFTLAPPNQATETAVSP